MSDITNPCHAKTIASQHFQTYIGGLVAKRYSRYQPADRDDLIQDANLTMLKTTRRIDNPWGYVHYAVPECYRTQERGKKRLGVQLAANSPEPSSVEAGPLVTLARKEEVLHLLSPLLNEERACLIMRICQNFTFHEIQEALELKSYGEARRLFQKTLSRVQEQANRSEK